MNIVDPPTLSLKTHKCDPDMSTVTCLAILSSSKKQMVASNNAIYNPQMSHFRMLVRIFQMMAVNSCELCKKNYREQNTKVWQKNSHFVFQVLSLAASSILWKNDRRMFLFSLRMSSVLIALETTRICPGLFHPTNFSFPNPPHFAANIFISKSRLFIIPHILAY